MYLIIVGATQRRAVCLRQLSFLWTNSTGKTNKWIRRSSCNRCRVTINFIANLHAIFNDILRKNDGTLLYCGLRQWASLSTGVFLNSVRLMGSTPFNAFTFWVIFCHITLNVHELLAFVYIFVECTLPWQSSIANRVLHKRQRKLIDVIDRHVMIFLTTYFRTIPMADVNFTSLVTSLITCYHCVSFTVAVVICKLQRILKGSSLLAQRVFTSMMRIMQPANRGLAYRIPCCRSQSGLFSASVVNVP